MRGRIASFIAIENLTTFWEKRRRKTTEKMGLTILYGSQTGQAEAIAKEIHSECADHGISADICCLSLTEKKVRMTAHIIGFAARKIGLNKALVVA